jgi:hypothetical protein
VSGRRLLAVALLLAGASPALAADEVVGGGPLSFGENPPENYESPQHFAFELKAGPYSPNIDSSPGLNGTTPFSDLFSNPGVRGRPPPMPLVELEFDWQIWHRFGSVGLGASLGFMRRGTKAFQYQIDPTSGMPIVDANGNEVQCQVQLNGTPTPMYPCVRTGDDTTLNVIPLELLAIYRFDVLAKRWHVPLVPYVKVGLAYYLWWIENGGGFLSIPKVTLSNGQVLHGFGGTFGWAFRPGIALLLDVLDPVAARTMDTEIGINHSYLFFELNYADINGFGAGNKLVLSDTNWAAGLAFEF